MSKKDKKSSKHVPPVEGEKKGYKSSFFTNVEWNVKFENNQHFVKIDQTEIPAIYLLTKIISENLDTLRFNNSNLSVVNLVGMDLSQGCSVQTCANNFISACTDESSYIFAQIWLDKYVQALSDCLFYQSYREFMQKSITSEDTTSDRLNKHSKEAYKFCDRIEREFLDGLK